MFSIGTPDFYYFTVFANAIHGVDSKMSFFDIVPIFILITGPTNGNKQICASHDQLKAFVADLVAGVKSRKK